MHVFICFKCVCLSELNEQQFLQVLQVVKGFSDVEGHAFFVVVGVESIFTNNQLAHHVQKAGFGRIFERFEQVPLQIFISDVRLDGHQQVVNSARRLNRKSEGRGEKSLEMMQMRLRCCSRAKDIHSKIFFQVCSQHFNSQRSRCFKRRRLALQLQGRAQQREVRESFASRSDAGCCPIRTTGSA